MDELEKFADHLRLAIQVTGHSQEWDLNKKKIDEEWLRHVEFEILERGLQLK